MQFKQQLISKCLVVGATGFVGKVLCKQLQAEGVHVRALIRKEQKGDWNEAVIGDLDNFQQQEAKLFEGIDTIYYLASIAHNKAAESEYQRVNVDLCLAFAKSAIKNGVKRFVYVSSTKAMAEPGDKMVDESFMDKPKDKYGLSKYNTEQGLLALVGFEHLVIVRPCLVYGAGVQGNLYSMMKMIDKGLFPPLPETNAKRSMISVTDLARALIAVSRNEKANRQIYILTDDQQYSVKAIENSMRMALGKKVPGWHIPAFVFSILGKLPVVSSIVNKLLGAALYSSQKIEKDTGWKPTQTLSTVLPDMVKHYRSQSGQA